MKSRTEELQDKFTRGFLGFWIVQYRISYLIILGLIIMGLVALFSIKKESSPAIKLGIISISTAYPGVNPIDMDLLVSDKIYEEIKGIKGIDKIESRSSLGFSSITLTLKTRANVKDVLNEVRNNVNRVNLPSDAKTPIITEIETNTDQIFSLYIFSGDKNVSQDSLFDKVKILKSELEALSTIDSVSLSVSGDGGPVGGGGGNDVAYDLEMLIDGEKLRSLGLSLTTIAGSLRTYSQDQPIGNFGIGDKLYDFRVATKLENGYEYLDVNIPLPKGGSVKLSELVTMKRVYKNDAVRKIVIPSDPNNEWQYAGLTLNKTDSASIFRSSDDAKKVIEEIMKSKDFEGYSYQYALDIADTIRDDYVTLAKEAAVTLFLVFVAMYLFVGFRDSLFATITLPLAFLSTFLILYLFGYTLNFLTNFSLILSFGIAIDTIIVIVQGASAKLRVGYEPRTAIMLALREYAVPVISGVSTTIVVFIPMMVLPGILGKFLAYIPITIFGVLASGLVLALTVNSALYVLFAKRRSQYVDDPHAIEYATPEEIELLTLEREGKEKLTNTTTPLRLRVIHSVTEGYKRILTSFLVNTYARRLSIFLPVVFLVFGFVFLAPKVGFELFPGDDNAFFSIEIKSPTGTKTEKMSERVGNLNSVFAGIDEIEYASITTKNNTTNINVQLTKKSQRKALGQRSVYEIEKIVLDRLKPLQIAGLTVETQIQENGPPSSKAIGLKLIADKSENLSSLRRVADDFQSYLRSVPGTKNVGKSSEDTPGQVIFRLKEDLLAEYGIPAVLILSTIRENMNGVKIGSIEDDGQDMDIVLKNTDFQKDAEISKILTLPLIFGPETYNVGTFVESTIENATASITRQDGDIQIRVESDVSEGTDTLSAQKLFSDFAESYTFPPGISYKAGGENQENAELITAILSAFFLSVLAIFAILTLQFNSFSQPAVILYSVVMALPFVMIGLLLTGNQFSMPFGIGFIAFTGIAVNHGIILIDAINQNLKKGMEGFTALVEAGSSRLEPMVLTTLTTALGILPISLQDKFWAGMGFTIIFGIIATTMLTLFVVKGIYYEIYIDKSPGFIRRLFRGIFGIFRKKRNLK